MKRLKELFKKPTKEDVDKARLQVPDYDKKPKEPVCDTPEKLQEHHDIVIEALNKMYEVIATIYQNQQAIMDFLSEEPAPEKKQPGRPKK